MNKISVLENQYSADFGDHVERSVHFIGWMKSGSSAFELSVRDVGLRFIEIEMKCVEGYFFVILCCIGAVAVS